MDKSEIMEEALFKNVKIITDEDTTIEGKVTVFETAYDNDDENEASICILTKDGEGWCLFESNIKSIEVI